MKSLTINILNPIAIDILKNLEELNVIKINEEEIENNFFKTLENIRSKNIDISLDEIIEEVDIVREKLYNESNI